MTERFERQITYGARPVNYVEPDTWTDEVKILYERLENGDYTALAPLIAIDLEFITDNQAMRALVMLKYIHSVPDDVARAELQKIASVIKRRPRHRGAKLPYGDRLNEQIRRMTDWIKKNKLLEVKRDRAGLMKRIRETRSDLNRTDQAKLYSALLESARVGTGYVRRARSWALHVHAHVYGVEPKVIEKRIARDLKSGRRKQ